MIKTNAVSVLSLESAVAILEAAKAGAESLGKPMAISVVDPGGELIAFHRMDGAPLLAVRIAQDKAFTAVSFGMATHEWFDFIKDDDPLRVGIVHTSRLVVFGGGYPVRTPDGVVGGIGVSGGHYSDDMQVATAGLAAVGVEA